MFHTILKYLQDRDHNADNDIIYKSYVHKGLVHHVER